MATKKMNEEEINQSTLVEARAWFDTRALKSSGAVCPCCQRFGKVYPRSFDERKLRVLQVYNLRPGDFLTPDEAIEIFAETWPGTKVAAYFEVVYMVAWDVLETAMIGDVTAHRITQLGIDFLAGQAPLDKYRYFYNRGAIDVPKPNPTQIYVNQVQGVNKPEIFGPAQ